MQNALVGKRVLVTQAAEFMGPALCQVFAEQGAAVLDEVVLLGESGEERISAETLATWAGTINYEVVTRISPYLERRVVG